MKYTELVYIAHPYRASTVDGIYENIHHARKIAKKWWAWGYSVICPCLNSAFMDGVIEDEGFISGDLTILSRCDILVLSGDWQNSKGCLEEKALAERSNIKIEYDEV